jgi:hypothetical protein
MPPLWNFAMSFEYYKAFSLSILFSHFYSLVGILYPILFYFISFFREIFKLDLWINVFFLFQFWIAILDKLIISQIWLLTKYERKEFNILIFFLLPTWTMYKCLVIFLNFWNSFNLLGFLI